MGSKRRRVIGSESKASEEKEVDRLSTLSDLLILHILCLLKDTRTAIQTCVLSKRWRNLWTHLPSLHLNGRPQKGYKSKKFIKFVDCILSKRKPSNIQYLQLWRPSYNNCKPEITFLDQVIAYASNQGVDEIDTSNMYFFRRCCLDLKTITRLHINRIPLHVKDVDILSKCASLVELILVKCKFIKTLVVVTLSNPNLVKLTLSGVLKGGKDDLIISAPGLLELNLVDMDHQPFSVQGCPLLQRVYIRGRQIDYKPKNRDPNLDFNSDLQRFYQKFIRKIIPKTKSLVLHHLGWKWIFMKREISASINIYAPGINQSVATLTWKMDANLSTSGCLKSDWNVEGFVKGFGNVGFVSCPGIIINTLSHSEGKLNKSHTGILDERFEEPSKKKCVRELIEAELQCIQAAFPKSVSVVYNWKCNVTRRWNNEIVWRMQWPN